MVKVVASHESIKRQIKDNIKNPFDAFNEYIWNAIDANAKTINITIETGQDFIKKLVIQDDGIGINYEELNKDLFKKFNTSNKSAENNRSIPRGKKGFGRFSFILFSNKVIWKTVYLEKKASKYKYGIEIENYKLDDYQPSRKTPTDDFTGTTVEFVFSKSNQSNLISTKNKDILKRLKDNIALEFSWIIELLNIKINLNGKPIEYGYLIEELKKTTKELDSFEFNIKFIKWTRALKNQSSRYYLLNSNNKEVYVETTKLNYKSDEFYHSIYIKSDYFDGFNLMKTRFEPTYKKLETFIDKYLKEKRKPFIKIFSENKYKEFEEKKLLPKFNDFEQKVKAPIYEEVVKEIIEFAPTLVSNTNESQRKVLLELINRLLDDSDSRDDLYKILEVLVDDDNRELLKDLKKKLLRYGLKNLLGIIKEVENRIQAIEKLKKMTSDEKKYYSESDLQLMIEEHFWIFGEEYHLMVGAEEDDFTKLRKLYYEKVKKMSPEDYEDLFISRRQVDLFVCGIMPEGRLTKNLIVEIKRPKENLKKEHYIQIDDYKDIIMKIPEFNTPERNQWDFVLLYTDISSEYRTFFENEIQNRFTGLAKENNNVNFRIFVRKWADVLAEVDFRMKFLKEKLENKKRKLFEKY